MSENIDYELLREAVGGFYGKDFDRRIDLPLHVQVKELMDWICGPSPRNRYRCSIPVEARDHDILLTQALGKLVTLVCEAAVSLPVEEQQP